MCAIAQLAGRGLHAALPNNLQQQLSKLLLFLQGHDCVPGHMHKQGVAGAAGCGPQDGRCLQGPEVRPVADEPARQQAGAIQFSHKLSPQKHNHNPQLSMVWGPVLYSLHALTLLAQSIKVAARVQRKLRCTALWWGQLAVFPHLPASLDTWHW
jgi:hypothetical protein